MALFIKQNEPRSDLQQRIAADLDKRLKTSNVQGPEVKTEKQALLDDTSPTSGSAWLWIVMGIVVLGAITFIALR